MQPLAQWNPTARSFPVATHGASARPALGEHGTGRTLFTSEVVEIGDWRCGGETCGWAADAVGTSHEVQVVRRGAYARARDGDVSLIHSGVAVFSNPGEEVRIAHPVAGGDARSIFRVSGSGLRAIAAHDPGAEDSPPR